MGRQTVFRRNPCLSLKIFACEGGGGDTPTTQLVLSTSVLGAYVCLFGGVAQCWLDDLCYLPTHYLWSKSSISHWRFCEVDFAETTTSVEADPFDVKQKVVNSCEDVFGPLRFHGKSNDKSQERVLAWWFLVIHCFLHVFLRRWFLESLLSVTRIPPSSDGHTSPLQYYYTKQVKWPTNRNLHRMRDKINQAVFHEMTPNYWFWHLCDAMWDRPGDETVSRFWISANSQVLCGTVMMLWSAPIPQLNCWQRSIWLKILSSQHCKYPIYCIFIAMFQRFQPSRLAVFC